MSSRTEKRIVRKILHGSSWFYNNCSKKYGSQGIRIHQSGLKHESVSTITFECSVSYTARYDLLRISLGSWKITTVRDTDVRTAVKI